MAAPPIDPPLGRVRCIASRSPRHQQAMFQFACQGARRRRTALLRERDRVKMLNAHPHCVLFVHWTLAELSPGIVRSKFRDPEVATQNALRLIFHGARCAAMSLASNFGPANAPTPSAGSPATRPSA
jgi:hypothetical protein